ncbi:hypothetical protein Tco_0425414 [Tanacetum coccineum]
MDMFRDTLQLPVETLDNPFVIPATIKIIESFMNRVGYQGVVDKVSAFFTTGNLAQQWQTMLKEIRATDDYKEYETMFVNVVVPMNQPQPVVSTQGTHRSTPRAHRIPSLTNASPLGKKRKQREKDVKSYADKFDASMIHDDDDDSSTRIEPGSHKEHLEVVDDDDNKEEKKYEKEGDEINKNITQELMDTVSLSTPTTSKDSHNQRSHFPLSTSSARCASQVVRCKMKSNPQDQDNDPILWEVLKHKFEKSSTSNTSCRDDNIHSQRHDDHQEDDAPPEGEKRVKRHKALKISKFARGSSSKHSAKDSTTYVSNQQQQQEWDAWVEEIVIDEDEVILKDETSKLITEFQNVDKHVPTIFDRARMEATLNDMLSNQFKNAEEYVYHLEQATNFMENQIVWKRRQEDIKRPVPRPLIFFGPQRNPNEPPRIKEVVRITTDQPHGLDFMEQIIVMRENDKPDSFSEADFNRVIWERVHDLQLGIESYQVKVNLTAPTLTFPGIEAYEPYSIVDKPNTFVMSAGKDRDLMRAFGKRSTQCAESIRVMPMRKMGLLVMNGHLFVVQVSVRGNTRNINASPETLGVLNKLSISSILPTCSCASSFPLPEKVLSLSILLDLYHHDRGPCIVPSNGIGVHPGLKLSFWIGERGNYPSVATLSHP